MQKIIPHLWFSDTAEEAVDFYLSVFGEGSVVNTTHYPDAGFEIHHMPKGTVLTVTFDLCGHRFMALNGGPVFTFTPAISFMVHCTSADEVDGLWALLSEGGTALMPLDAYPFSSRYGWIQDKYGVSWQLIYTEGAEKRSIVPSLMYVGDQAGRAEEAIMFYTSLFPDSAVGEIARYGAGQEPDKEGTVMYANFTLAGQTFAAMDSAQAHAFTFNEALSLLVECEDQQEIDRLWEMLSASKDAEQCGWLKDRFGVSWQIVPRGMDAMLNNEDATKAEKAMNAMLQMKKIDIQTLKDAFNS
jgi:predicted 3-demethylubiquinone-9 3-methyltransferase (glyoxalase superfamily)